MNAKRWLAEEPTVAALLNLFSGGLGVALLVVALSDRVLLDASGITDGWRLLPIVFIGWGYLYLGQPDRMVGSWVFAILVGGLGFLALQVPFFMFFTDCFWTGLFCTGDEIANVRRWAIATPFLAVVLFTAVAVGHELILRLWRHFRRQPRTTQWTVVAGVVVLTAGLIAAQSAFVGNGSESFITPTRTFAPTPTPATPPTATPTAMAPPPNVQLLATWGSRGEGDGQFSNIGAGVPGPRGIAVDASGNVYVADSGNHRVQRFTGSGEFLSKWGSEGRGDGQLDTPAGIAVDASGNVYVADLGNGRVQVFSSTGEFLRKILTSVEPWLVAVDSSGNLYVWGQGSGGVTNNQVHVFSPSGEFLRQWSAPLAGNIMVDGSDDVYVTDSRNNQVQVFNSGGRFLRKWGSSGDGDGQFSNPTGIAVGPSGNVYVTESSSRVQVFGPDGRFLLKWGSLGDRDGEFKDPQGIAVDALGNVYVMDTRNQRVQVFRVELP